MFTIKIDPIELIILGVLFCTGTALLGAGIYGFYLIINEIILLFSTEKPPLIMQSFLSYLEQQDYKFSGVSITGETFSFGIGIGIMQWFYAFLAVLLLRFIPEILKIFIHSGTTIILETLKSFRALERKPTPDQDERNF